MLIEIFCREKTKTSSGARFRSTQHTQRLTTNLDKARNALHRLEPLLQNVIEPGASGALQLGEILKLLLEVYKQCRYMRLIQIDKHVS